MTVKFFCHRLKFLCVALLLGATMGRAQGTVSISCAGMDSDLGVNIVFGAGPVWTILDVVIESDDRIISTRPSEAGAQVFIARSFTDDDLLQIDLVDDQALDLIAAIRVLRYYDDTNGAYQIGYVRLDNNLPVGVSCDGP
jgi:hypothetical protein